MNLRQRMSRIKLLLMDVDGVLSDGRIYHLLGPKRELIELKGVDTQDGMGLTWLVDNGIRTGVISGRVSTGFAERARLLKMSFVIQGTVEKIPAFEGILAKTGLRPEETAFMGDDFPDLPLLRRAGLGVAVANARPEVKRAARYVTKRPGGSGAVREVAELLLQAQGRWAALKRRYEAR